MLRRITAIIVSAALCSTSLSPALAQDHRLAAFDAPAGADTAARGANATVNLRVPLGGRSERSRPAGPSLGLTVGYGQMIGAPALDGRRPVRELRLADFRLERDGRARAELASFDLAHLDEDKRLHLGEQGLGPKGIILIILLAIAGVFAIDQLTDGNSNSSDSSDDESPGAD